MQVVISCRDKLYIMLARTSNSIWAIAHTNCSCDTEKKQYNHLIMQQQTGNNSMGTLMCSNHNKQLV